MSPFCEISALLFLFKFNFHSLGIVIPKKQCRQQWFLVPVTVTLFGRLPYSNQKHRKLKKIPQRLPGSVTRVFQCPRMKRGGFPGTPPADRDGMPSPGKQLRITCCFLEVLLPGIVGSQTLDTVGEGVAKNHFCGRYFTQNIFIFSRSWEIRCYIWQTLKIDKKAKKISQDRIEGGSVCLILKMNLNWEKFGKWPFHVFSLLLPNRVS